MPTYYPTIVLDRDAQEAGKIAHWLRDSGLGVVATARTADEAIFMLGHRRAGLLVIDEAVSEIAERRLLAHIDECGYPPPMIVRLLSPGAEAASALSLRAQATAVAHKPLQMYEVVVCVGTAMQRPDLVGRMDRGADKSADNLAAARRMQQGLLPTPAQLGAIQDECGVGISGLCRPGEEMGGDFWGAWQTGRGRFALALADFAGHGLSAALNTFRLHAILSEDTLPRGLPAKMTALLNARLHTLLPRGHYATMIYAQIDPCSHRIAWCSAGGPPPMFVGTRGVQDLLGRGLPLGVRASTTYVSSNATMAGCGILCLFSDGLYESGGGSPDVPRSAIADMLAASAALAEAGRLVEASEQATQALEQLRSNYTSLDHSDDVLTVCVAIGPSGLQADGQSTALTANVQLDRDLR